MQPIRILQIVPNMHSAGIENWLMNIYRNIDRDKVQFDFLVHYEKRFDFDDEIESLGGRIYRMSLREDNNLFKYISDLNKFFSKHNEYKVIHAHMPSLAYLYLGIAKKYNVKHRILHSHNAFCSKNVKGYLKMILSKIAKYNATKLLACSHKAGIFQYGKSEFTVINNAIDIDKFSYNYDIRNQVRKELNIEDKFVIGHIGRFNVQKNHVFIINILNKIKREKNNIHLILVGTGELKEEIERLVYKLGLCENVTFLGVRNDTYKLYQAFDLFILPSLHEGLPVVGVEAQAAGLPILFSEEVTKEVKLTDEVKFLPINKGVEIWKEKILDIEKKKILRDNNKNQLTKLGYNVKIEAQKLIALYTSAYEC